MRCTCTENTVSYRDEIMPMTISITQSNSCNRKTNNKHHTGQLMKTCLTFRWASLFCAWFIKSKRSGSVSAGPWYFSQHLQSHNPANKPLSRLFKTKKRSVVSSTSVPKIYPDHFHYSSQGIWRRHLVKSSYHGALNSPVAIFIAFLQIPATSAPS